MSRQRFVLLLIAALVAISGAFFLSAKRSAPPVAQGAALLPAMSGDIAAVTAVTVKKGASVLTVHKSGDQWTVAERADYPADVSKLRKLLLALRDAKIVETKTSNPASFAVIGVEDPAEPGATSSEVTVTAPSSSFTVIVGKSIGEGNFVRRSGENQSYSVEPAISFETEPRYWIDTKLFKLPGAQIQSEQVKSSDGTAYALHRSDAAAITPAATPASTASGAPPVPAPLVQPFVLDGVPAGRKALDSPVIAPSPSAISDLTAEDVAEVADVDFKQPSQSIVTFTDGTVVTLTGAVIADKHWIQIASSKDTALSAKVQGRAFQVASYRYDAIFKPLDQLLVPKEIPATKSASHKGPASSPTP